MSSSWRMLWAFHLMLKAILSFFSVKEFFLRSMLLWGALLSLEVYPPSHPICTAVKTSLVVAWNLFFQALVSSGQTWCSCFRRLLALWWSAGKF